MWELFSKLSHGRISLRRIYLVATVIVLAIFSATSFFDQPVAAADATRTDGTVVYNENTYTPLGQTQVPGDMPSSTQGYVYIDEAGDTAYFLFTDGDPATATSAEYVTYRYTPPDNYSGKSPPKAISIADAPGSAEEAGGQTNCDGSITDGLGWILCPVVNFMASGMDHLYEVLSSFLVVRPVQTDTSSSLYRMWAIVRDIANVAFVGVFLFVVYSQVTSIGITNYGIKRILPRLIVGAILVNISYWIASLGVDISNMLGYSIHDLFSSVFSSLNNAAQYKDVESLSWSSITGAILSGGTATVGLGLYAKYVILSQGLPGALTLIIPILVGVLMAVLIALLIMAARQALITLLVIISPLAFVAYLLPNTEKYFEKWRDLFVRMLMIFPMFAALFGAAKLAGLAIIQNANSLNLIILGMAVMVAPVVITPMLIKFSGSLLGRIANLANNPKKGVIDRTRNWAQDRADLQKARILAGQGRNNWANRQTRKIDYDRRKREGWKKVYEGRADNRFSDTHEGHRIHAESTRVGTRKQEIENAFGRTALGKQVQYESRMVNIDKDNVENEFNNSSQGYRVDRARRTTERDKNRIANQQEFAWNRSVVRNPEQMVKEMEARRAEERATQSKDRVEQFHSEVVAQGENTEYIMNLRGATASQKNGMLKVARDIKDTHERSAFIKDAKSNAERQIAENKVSILKDNSMIIEGKTVVEYAAGVKGAVGQRSIVARAKTESSKFMLDDIKNIESTLDYDISSNVDKLHELFRTASTDEERVAYTSIMAKRGGPGANKLRAIVEEMDARHAAGTISQSDLNDYKELVLAQNPNINGLGKDLEFYFTNASYSADHPDPTLAGTNKSFRTIANEVETWANLTPESFSRMNIVNQMHGLRILAHKAPDKYRQLVGGVLASPTSMANMKVDVINAIAQRDSDGDFIRDESGRVRMIPPENDEWFTGPYNTPNPSELTEFEAHSLSDDVYEDDVFTPRPGDDRDASYWRDRYYAQREATRARLEEARERGADYTNDESDET